MDNRVYLRDEFKNWWSCTEHVIYYFLLLFPNGAFLTTITLIREMSEGVHHKIGQLSQKWSMDRCFCHKQYLKI